MSNDKSVLFEQALRLFAPRLLESETLRREYRFCPPRLWRFDWAWLRTGDKFAVEVDGGQWAAGGGRHNRDSDREKLNVAVALGWYVYRFSTQQLETDPASCVELVLCRWHGTELPERFRRSRRAK